MKIIIPMAGMGVRFSDRGYKEPKPLIKINGKRIIEYILESYSDEDEYVFICNEVHLRNTDMEKILLQLKPTAKIISIPQHKLGPVYTIKPAYDYIEDESPVIVSYCDNPHIWQYSDFKNFVQEQKLDGCILTHTGFHPHTLSNTKMAFLKEKNGMVEEIKEKESYTDNPMSEHASTGTYYFSSGKNMKKFFDQALEENITYNGEYYVTLVYNLLIKKGLRVGYYDTDLVTVFGTPDEVENFNAWATILKAKQVKTEEDALKCYKYWRKYHDSVR